MPMLSREVDAASGDGANGGRGPTVVPAPDAADAELSARPRRRTFTAGDKLRILAHIDRAVLTGGIGAVVRREGLYSSTLSGVAPPTRRRRLRRVDARAAWPEGRRD